MTKQKGFTQEFEDEAVRLARTSGRTRRELAENLGVGLSTLTRWIARNRDREIDAPEKARSEDMTTELGEMSCKPPLPPNTVQRVVDLALGPPPGESTRWTGRELAKAAGVS